MRKAAGMSIVVVLALVGVLAGSAGARQSANVPSYGTAEDSLEDAYSAESLALFALADDSTAEAKSRGATALSQSQAALTQATSALKKGTGAPTSVQNDVDDAAADDSGALTDIAIGRYEQARTKIHDALGAKDDAMAGLEVQMMSGFPHISEYFIPVKDSGPTSIVEWGNRLWFTEANKGMLSSLDIFAPGVRQTQAAGAASPGFTSMKLPVHSRPQTLAEGPDGALWFTDTWQSAIGRLSPNGKLKEFKLAPASQPYGITTGPDGALWFTELGLNKVGRITTTGKVTEFPLKGGSAPQQIVAGPDHALWFTEYVSDKIGRITTKGVIREFPLPKKSGPAGLAVGKDGALWFTEYTANKIGRITTAGKITQLKLHYNNEGPDGIVALPNGSLAYVTYNDSSVGVITNGQISENEIQNGGRNPNALTVGPGGQLYVTEYTANKIARVAVG